MMRAGRITLNGRVVTELGTRADPDRDHIKVDGKLITRAEEHRYIIIYKPKEVMTTVEDPQGRRTVIDLVRGVRERIYPVGRLDYHSEGLVLLTNDGELAYKVSHPKHGSVKTYNVKVRGVPEERIVDKLRRGITLDGKRTLPCEIAPIKTTGKTADEGNSWWEVKLLATLKDVPVKPRRVAAKRPAAKRPASKKGPAKTSRGTKSRSVKARGATTSRGTTTSRAAKAPRSRAARRG